LRHDHRTGRSGKSPGQQQTGRIRREQVMAYLLQSNTTMVEGYLVRRQSHRHLMCQISRIWNRKSVAVLNDHRVALTVRPLLGFHNNNTLLQNQRSLLFFLLSTLTSYFGVLISSTVDRRGQEEARRTS
jgi:hypothetical protein